jgi:hypothetical protein
MTTYTVSDFGIDCLGNATGYRVQRRVWEPSPFSRRKDGLGLTCETAGTFVADIYKPGSHAEARAAAHRLCDSLNATLSASAA